MADAKCTKVLVDMPHADPMMKVASVARIPFLLSEGGNECLQIINLRVGITKLSDGTHVVSASWQSAAGGHWCGPMSLIVGFCKLGLELGRVDLGKWEAKCGQVSSYETSKILVPANYFGEAHQLSVPEQHIVSSAC